MERILIIEDDVDIAGIERDYLEIANYMVEIAYDGSTGMEKATNEKYDLIILDLMLPGIDGFTVCRKLRESFDIPILMVTARREDIDMIRGLGLGADDYIEKPFSPSVLVARVKAHLARYLRLKNTGADTPSEIIIGEMRINTVTRRVVVGEEEIELKNKEYMLLQYMAQNVDIVLNRETLYERIWGLEAMGDSATVAVHINRLRDKIEEDPGNPQYIQTVRGAGYRLNGGKS